MSGAEMVRRKGSLARTARAVAGSFFGVRRGADLERDQAELNPVHVIVAGIAGALLFILVLVVLVRWVVASGVAS